MGPEEDDDDAPSPRPVPHPEDRLWRHPSEMAKPAGRAGGPPMAAFGPKRVRPTNDRHRAVTVALVAGVIGAALAITGIAFVDGLDTRVVEERVIQRVPVRPIVSTPGIDDSEGVRRLLDQVQPTVVEIEATSAQGTVSGSGVLFRDDGYILTSAELVADSGAIVVWASGRRLKAGLVGADVRSGVAVVKVDGHDFPTAVLGSSADLAVGDPAIVVDYSAHDEPVASIGRVRALNQQVAMTGGVKRHGMIEADTPLRPRAEGAPMWNGSGVVVGIVTNPADTRGVDEHADDEQDSSTTTPSSTVDMSAAGASAQSPGSTRADHLDDLDELESPARAVPIDIARAVADDLIDLGVVRRVWLGIDGSDAHIDMPQTSMFAGTDQGGVRLTKIMAGSPAEGAGLLIDDVILAIDHRPIDTSGALVATIKSHHPGDEISIVILRGGDYETIEVVLGEKPG